MSDCENDCDSDCGVSASKRPCTDAELQRAKAFLTPPKSVCVILVHEFEDGMFAGDLTINYTPFVPGLAAQLKGSTPRSRAQLHGVIPGITETGDFDNTTWVQVESPSHGLMQRVPVTSGNTVWKTVDDLETFTLDHCQCVIAYE